MVSKVKEFFGPTYKQAEIGDIVLLATDVPLTLECGKEISSFPIAYKSWGKLNKDKSNAILLCHGLTADQYASGTHPVTGKKGWWQHLIGPGKIFDTDHYFIICPNVLGGCMGSFGPKSINSKTGKAYNLDFPVITITDMTKVLKLLTEYLGIEKLFSIIGGSMGGMLALEWASRYKENAISVVAIATASRHTAQNIAFHEIGRQAIMADPNWHKGEYLNKRIFPEKGLAVARMTAHVTYLSQAALHRKFGRQLQDRENISYGFDADFKVESYLRYQGFTFIDRFDPNSYLYITRAMDYYDLPVRFGGVLSNAFKGTKARFCIISFSSDWLFPTEEAKIVVHALNAASADVSFVEVKTDKGHDAFLLNEPEFFATLGGFLKGVDPNP